MVMRADVRMSVSFRRVSKPVHDRPGVHRFATAMSSGSVSGRYL
ncbi:hypothetical protein EBESD8_12510 [Rhodococcus aetherivorans]|nr:hypothetical protein EBESD8_12510 [Rhodococcus aetherivorans]